MRPHEPAAHGMSHGTSYQDTEKTEAYVQLEVEDVQKENQDRNARAK
jgi:hypothetical protein